MFKHAFITSVCTERHTEDVPKKHVTFTEAFPLLYIEREQINLKVVQTLGNDKVQVGLTFLFYVLMLIKVLQNLSACLTVMCLLCSSVRRVSHKV